MGSDCGTVKERKKVLAGVNQKQEVGANSGITFLPFSYFINIECDTFFK